MSDMAALETRLAVPLQRPARRLHRLAGLVFSLMINLHEALESAGKQAELIIYPPYQDDGHRMFFEVGDYWEDVEEFIRGIMSFDTGVPVDP